MSNAEIAILSGLIISTMTSVAAFIKAHSSTKALDLEKQTQAIAQRVLTALKEIK